MPATEWATRLLAWFDRHRRPMPWRDYPSPYRVWISEVMLQQTQVATVIPYFERFTRRFPDVRQLAGADIQEVLKLWEGLGYYSRARLLHAAARQIAFERQGVFPASAAEWMALPGVGDYTAAAIASIVYGEPVPAVDGNVLRVGARVLGIRDRIQAPATRRAIRDWTASALASGVPPSAFNQAMMEVGALVCRPRNPCCGDCPFQQDCVAFRQNLTAEIPLKIKRVKPPHYTEVAAIIRNRNQRVLLVRRPPEGLLGGLWEFPCIRREGREPLIQTLDRLATDVIRRELTILRRLGCIQHAFSHFTQTLHVFECTPATPAATRQRQPGIPSRESRWCTRREIAALPLSKAHREIASRLEPGGAADAGR